MGKPLERVAAAVVWEVPAAHQLVQGVGRRLLQQRQHIRVGVVLSACNEVFGF